MLERYSSVLRIVCFILAGIVLYEISRLLRPRGEALAAFRPGNIVFRASPSLAGTNAIPADIQARIEKIKASQVLGRVLTPPPVALLGIAGGDVFIRAPNGQTVLMQEGEEFGGLKLLRVGTNRVLVQYQGKTNELTVFEGFGSESLLGNQK